MIVPLLSGSDGFYCGIDLLVRPRRYCHFVIDTYVVMIWPITALYHHQFTITIRAYFSLFPSVHMKDIKTALTTYQLEDSSWIKDTLLCFVPSKDASLIRQQYWLSRSGVLIIRSNFAELILFSQICYLDCGYHPWFQELNVNWEWAFIILSDNVILRLNNYW